MEKKIRFKGSPELGDGCSSVLYITVQELKEAIDNYAENMTNVANEGERFTVELVAMTDAEVDALEPC